MNNIDKRTLPKDIETIRQISETKREQSREAILEKSKGFTLEESDKQLAIPTHRKKNHISLEEYQSLLKSGKTVPEIIRTTSKHLVYFYNVLLKGGINLTKEEFETMYNEGISLDEISKAKNIPREHMTFLREFYGIKRKGATFQKRITNEKPLSQEAKDVILGSILGDGHITKWGYFSEKHSEKQIGYLEWKGNVLKSILTDKSYGVYSSTDKRSGTQIESFTLRTISHSFIYEIRNKFYQKNGLKWIKTIPENISDLMNEEVLSIWFMDDGNTDWGYRNGTKEYSNSKPQCKICSESFSLEENLLLGKMLENKYGLISNIRFKNPSLHERPYLRFDCDSSLKLINIVKKFATKDLLYKVDEQSYLKHQKTVINKDSMKRNFIARHNIIITNNIINDN